MTLTVLNEAEDKSPAQELTEDLLAIISSFSGRLYGLRGNHKREALLQAAKAVLESPDERQEPV